MESNEEYYEGLENELARRLTPRNRKTSKPSMVIDGASTKLLGKLMAERNSGK